MATLPSISVVIPCYNAATWLPDTLQKIAVALTAAGITTAEIVMVDDGSHDKSADVAKSLSLAYPVKVIRTPNQGRFLARKTGVEQAQYDYILFNDTRVHLDPGGIKFITDQLAQFPDRQIWNAHVNVAKAGNTIARFGDAITFIGWRRYFANPRTTSYDLEDFDHYPKGTTAFFVPRSLILQAIAEFEKTAPPPEEMKHANDDTKLIRWLAGQQRINISPEFSCTYYARTSLKQFIKHTYHRGQVFVDGFLSPGNRFFYPLVAFLIPSVAGLVLLIMVPILLFPFIVLGLLAWGAEFLIARRLGVPKEDALSLFALTPLFAVMYGAGIWRAVIRKALPTSKGTT